MKLSNLWKRVTTTRHSRELEELIEFVEEDNEHLRAENRAMLNSILGIAGLPPIFIEPGTGAGARPRHPIRGAQTARAIPAPVTARERTNHDPVGPEGAPRVATPMRRRSWQQIYRLLEFESAKKKTPEPN